MIKRVLSSLVLGLAFISLTAKAEKLVINSNESDPAPKATFTKVVADYADRLAAADGRLYLSGLDPSITRQLHRTGNIDGPVRTFEATPVVGESTLAAYLDAETWVVKRRGE